MFVTELLAGKDAEHRVWDIGSRAFYQDEILHKIVTAPTGAMETPAQSVAVVLRSGKVRSYCNRSFSAV